MTTPQLNLLRFPRRRLWALSPLLACLLGGLLTGALGGVAWGRWCEQQLQLAMAQRQTIQSRLQQQLRGQAEAAAHLQQATALRQMNARRAEWQSRRALQQLLHERLQQLAASHSLKVLQWQSDEKRLQLQAWLPQAQALPAVQEGLMSATALSWRLQDLASAASGGLQFTLEADIPAPSPEGKRP